MNQRTPFETLDGLASRLSDLVPEDMQAAREDLTDNIKATLASWFERMDLVTREEFDVQQAVLRRTREKLERLEAQVAALEAGDDPGAGDG